MKTATITPEVQTLLDAITESQAVKYHCDFVNGGGFNSPIKGEEEDQYGGWMKEEYEIMEGLSAIRSYHFCMERDRFESANKELATIQRCAATLRWWLRM